MASARQPQSTLDTLPECSWDVYNPSTDPISPLARHEQTTIFRLQTGHCGLWAHLKQIGIMDSALWRSRTDGPPHPPGLSHLAETETSVMAAGWVHHQQAVGNGRRPAPHHPIPGNMWTKGLSMADQPQKKKKFPLELTWVQTPFPRKLFRMRV